MNKVNIKSYAGTAEKSPYDELARHNREYQRLLKAYPEIIREYAHDAKKVADIACGTGNFTLAIYEALRGNEGLRIHASDISKDMINIFNQKIRKRNLEDIIITSVKDATDPTSYESEFFDLINITHALNYTGVPEKVMRNIYSWLKPGGVMVAVDIGRELIVSNWSKAVFRWGYEDMAKSGYGILAIFPTLAHFIKYRAAKKENENFHKGQLSGTYPMHTSEEFKKWVENAGFEILYFSSDFYRDPATGKGIDDFVVARKK